MKTIAIIVAFMLAGFAALPAQAQIAGWITACGNPEYNAFGTAECPAKDVGDFMQTLEADYFSELAEAVNTRAMSKAVRLLGAAVSSKAADGGCRDEDVMLLLQASEIWNESVTLSTNASEVEIGFFDYFGRVVDNGAEFVAEGC